MLKRLIFFCSFLITTISFAQTGVAGGFSMLKAFGIQGVYPGLHLGVEIPRDAEVSYFARITYTLPNYTSDSLLGEAVDPMTNPSVDYKNVKVGMNYLNIEGGTRYYLGNGYDYGWSAYGGTLLMLSVNTVRLKPDEDFDPSKYQFKGASGEELPNRGTIVALSFGLNAGVKNHYSFGMLYFDMSLAYSLFHIPSNELAQTRASFSPLLFGFNIGFRKDLY